jgi:hypothetical protein
MAKILRFHFAFGNGIGKPVSHPRYNPESLREASKQESHPSGRNFTGSWMGRRLHRRIGQARRGLRPLLPPRRFTPLQAKELDVAAAEINSTPMQVALAWLLHRSPNILLIPGTSSAEHLRENLKAAELQLSSKVIAELNTIATAAV